MEKFLAILLTAVLAFSLLTGCGNPVFDDFENFLNVEMVEVNANYDQFKAQAGSMGDLEDDAAFASGIKDGLLPLIEDSLTKLEKINPQTDEVKVLKEKYVAVMEAYKEGFSQILDGIETLDEEKLLAGNEKAEEGFTLLDEYNEALEALAKEVGAEIEY